jgi:hypothetical protein
MSDRYIGTPEASEILNVPASTLDYWAYRASNGYPNDGPDFAKFGRLRRYKESDVRAWAETRFTGREVARGGS